MKRKNLKLGKAIIVKWFDSAMPRGNNWESSEWPEEPACCATLGFLLHDNIISVTIASSIHVDPENDNNIVGAVGFMTIPWGCINSIEYIPLKKGKK